MSSPVEMEIPRAQDAAPGAAADRVLAANLDALKARGVSLDAPEGPVRAAGAGTRAAAEAGALPFTGADGLADPARPVKGIVLVGLRSGWMLRRIAAATPRQPDGYQAPILIIENDVQAARAGLAETDLRDVLASPRVRLFVGAGAEAAFEAHLMSRLDFALPEYVVPAPVAPGMDMTGGAAAARAADAIRRAHAAQQQGHADLEARVRATYDMRSVDWWRTRYEAALGAGPALRVLIPVSRYSTFVKHSALDLAEALNAMGHEARILSEPDDSSRLVTLAYLRQFAQWQPDLMVLINYTRRHMGGAAPANVPFVCWVQDRMPQLFDEAAGRSQGALDFLMGHLHVELFEQFGYPRDAARSRFWFVPASARKFHDGPAVGGRRASSPCDLAYISHQSETVDAARARLMPAFAGNPTLARAVERIHAQMLERMDAGRAAIHVRNELRTPLVSKALAEEGVTAPDPRLVGAILSNYVIPIGERMWRHATLEWASRIAQRRGWRFAIFGNGWDKHPTLASFARPALEHDEALREVYRSSRACMHASLTTNAHQRVFECALSGGLMLRRWPSPDIEVGRIARIFWLLQQHTPVERTPQDEWRYELPPGSSIDPQALFHMFEREIPTDGVWVDVMNEARRRRVWKPWSVVDIHQLPDLAFPRAWETAFSSESELELAACRAIEDADWRRETVEQHRQAALARHTHDRFARDVISLVSGAICAGTEAQVA